MESLNENSSPKGIESTGFDAFISSLYIILYNFSPLSFASLFSVRDAFTRMDPAIGSRAVFFSLRPSEKWIRIIRRQPLESTSTNLVKYVSSFSHR